MMNPPIIREQIKIWDGTEQVSVNTSNQLEVSETNSIDIKNIGYAISSSVIGISSQLIDIRQDTCKISSAVMGISSSLLPLHTNINVNNDATDAGNPLKVGSKATGSGTTFINQSPVPVDNGDRVNAWLDRSGRFMTGVESQYINLDNINYAYNGTVGSSSSWIHCSMYKQATLGFQLGITGTPTDIVFKVECGLSGTSFACRLMNDFLGDLRYDDTAVGAAGITECVTFPIASQNIRITVICTGTTTSALFSVSGAVLYLRN